MFNLQLPELTPNRLAIKLSVKGERSVRSGHPWVFSNSVEKINKEGAAGDLAIIFGTRSNEVIGVGLYDPESPIRIKMLHHNGPATIDSTFFSEKVAAAFAIRQPLLDTKTTSYRLLFGENDEFPGFITDIYADVAVVKLYSAIWFPYLELVLRPILEITGCKTIVLRLSRKLQLRETYNLTDGLLLYGALDSEVVRFQEHGVHFSANVVHGHKTGYFLDHRYNRKRIGALAKGKNMLDVFAYAGGFSVHALANGAKEVTALDISEQALEMATRNASLNKFNGSLHTLCGDAFELLENFIKEGKMFDVVVIDPPSFAKSEKEIGKALKKYQRLAGMGAKLTAKKGLLFLASCSSRVSSEAFFELNKEALDGSGRAYRILQRSGHDIDHPVSFPEGSYLKAGYYEFRD